ncbi:MAG: MoxR family ATPase [Desulfuromonadaceae bacterium]|nr:MoxR family ATPase [Desulfuromonadaceae bacterium]
MESLQKRFVGLSDALRGRIIGQPKLIERLLIALLADGHMLVEGAPGLAKTRAIRLLAEYIQGDFHRIQFTPDLLPADLTGTEIYRPQDGSFAFHKGPLFNNLILADEVNRAPAKVQSALLEAMAERQITCGHTTYPMSEPFLVMATQNPIEQEGTYPLPEAQLDRFLLYVTIDYPALEAERAILQLARAEAQQEMSSVATQAPKDEISRAELAQARRQVLGLYLAPNLEEYLVQLIMATREPLAYGDDIAGWIQYGASPRATIALDRCARARAWLSGRDYVTPEDIQSLAYDVLRHRILLTYEAQAQGISCDHLIRELLARVPLP